MNSLSILTIEDINKIYKQENWKQTAENLKTLKLKTDEKILCFYPEKFDIYEKFIEDFISPSITKFSLEMKGIILEENKHKKCLNSMISNRLFNTRVLDLTFLACDLENDSINFINLNDMKKLEKLNISLNKINTKAKIVSEISEIIESASNINTLTFSLSDYPFRIILSIEKIFRSLGKLKNLKHLKFWVKCRLTNTENNLPFINLFENLSELETIAISFLKTNLTKIDYKNICFGLRNLKNCRNLCLHIDNNFMDEEGFFILKNSLIQMKYLEKVFLYIKDANPNTLKYLYVFLAKLKTVFIYSIISNLPQLKQLSIVRSYLDLKKRLLLNAYILSKKAKCLRRKTIIEEILLKNQF